MANSSAITADVDAILKTWYGWYTDGLMFRNFTISESYPLPLGTMKMALHGKREFDHTGSSNSNPPTVLLCLFEGAANYNVVLQCLAVI